MKTDLFKCLSPEIVVNILLKLSVQTIARSKCVCKPWRDLLSTDFFVNSHFSKSVVPSLAVMNFVMDGQSRRCDCQVLEFEDEVDDVESSDLRYCQVTKFDFPVRGTIVGAANGLLLLSKFGDLVFIICNPITRHYVEICGPRESPFVSLVLRAEAFGFGVSRITGQYKVVLICSKSQFASESECRVYTLGTGSWRRVGLESARASLLLTFEDFVSTAFLEGNLHWAVRESPNKDKPLITCFDLETECFSSFGAPASRGGLSVLRDCLCFCEWNDEKIVVWSMKEYAVEKSWSKDYVITQGPLNDGSWRKGHVFPIKVFENGDMLLMLLQDKCVRYFFNKTKTFQDYGIFGAQRVLDVGSSLLFTPSFQTLKGLGMENIISF